MVRCLVLATLLALLVASPVAAEAEEVEHFDTLEAMTAGSDAVVLGRIGAVAPGRIFSGCGYSAAALRIERVLAGRVPVGAFVLTVEYFGFCGALPALGREIPAERGVFFLRNKAEDRRLFGGPVSALEIEAERPFWRTVIGAGTVVERGDRAHVPDSTNAEWLGAWEGKPFGAFVEAVAGPAPREPASPAGVDPGVLPVGLVVAVAAVLLAVGVVAARRRRRTIDP